MRIDLNGEWQLTTDLGQQARAARPGYDARSWHPVPVPGHWSNSHPALGSAERVLYRRTFRWEASLAANQRVRLRFDGIIYQAKVWLNGGFLGEQAGFVAPALFDVTRHLVPGENVVTMEVFCPIERGLHNRRAILGALSPGPVFGLEAQPGGIWRDVALEVLTGVVPESLRLRVEVERLPVAPVAPDEVGKGGSLPAAEGPATATIQFEMECTAPVEGRLVWKATLAPESFEGSPATLTGSQVVRRGWNRIHAAFTLVEPHFWWTWDQGRPDLYRFGLEFGPEGGPLQSVERLVGVRKVELRGPHLYLNGRRIFARGVTYGPPDLYVGAVSAEDYQRDLARIKDGNANLVRIFGHVGKPALYEGASRLGLLLWQDIPLYGEYQRGVLGEAVRQAVSLVYDLGDWPAVGLWCAHGEPRPETAPADSFVSRSLRALSRLAGNWNSGSLAPAVQKAVRAADPGRPCLAFPDEWSGGPVNLRIGWGEGHLHELDRALKLYPERARFAIGFGSAAFPDRERTLGLVRGEWPAINWQELSERHLLPAALLERYVPHSLATSLEAYADATRQYQAMINRRVIERFRRQKYEPAGGLLTQVFKDAQPAVSHGLHDYWRGARPAWEAVREAYRPVLICMDWPNEEYSPGARLGLGVYLVNDLQQNLTGTWEWTVLAGGEPLAGERSPAYLPPDRSVQAGSVDWTVPAGLLVRELELVLRLSLAGGEPVVARYPIRVAPE